MVEQIDLVHDNGAWKPGRDRTRTDRRVHGIPIVGETFDEIAAVLPGGPRDEGDAGDQGLRPSRAARSESTIMAMRSSKLTVCSQPRTSRALVGSPMRRSTSAGRMKRGSSTMCCSQSEMPT